MRGAPGALRDLRNAKGIIPADAGSTPRKCPPNRPRQGSSPRMRGAPLRAIKEAITLRIIPADAGSTNEVYGNRFDIRDHPRGCGEHLMRVAK